MAEQKCTEVEARSRAQLYKAEEKLKLALLEAEEKLKATKESAKVTEMSSLDFDDDKDGGACFGVKSHRSLLWMAQIEMLFLLTQTNYATWLVKTKSFISPFQKSN